MREIVSPLSGVRSPISRVDPYKVLGFKPTLVADMTRDYYRNTSRQTFDDIFTHSRLGNATMVDSDGLLKWGPHNLLTYSEQFDSAYWLKQTAGTGSAPVVTANYGTAPNGAGTADRVQFALGGGTTSGDYSRLTSWSTTFVAANHSHKLWVKLTSGSTPVSLRMSISGVAAKIITVNDTWSVVDVNWDASAGSFNTRLELVGGYGTSDAADILVWGAHLHRSDLGGMAPVPADARVAGSTTYVPTTSTARYLPRRHNHVYNGTAWVDAGTLIETEARTNLETQSDGRTSWGVDSGSSLSASTVEGQDGSFLTELNEGTATTAHRANRQIATTADTEYTYSAEIAPGTSQYVIFGNNYGGICIDTTDGSITETIAAASTTTTNGDVEPLGNGHFRASVTVKHATVTTLFTIFATSDTATPGTTTRVFTGTSRTGYFGLVQVEQASTPSSYIPTSGSTVTRAADTSGLTVDSSIVPWPTPKVIGEELVTNGGFDTDSDWTLDAGVTISGGTLNNTIDTAVFATQAGVGASGKIYKVSYDVTSRTIGSVSVGVGSVSGAARSSVGSYVDYIVATSSDGVFATSRFGSAFVGSLDNISVKEINPLAVCIQMKGRMTYADENVVAQATFTRWNLNGSNYIIQALNTGGVKNGNIYFNQAAAGVSDGVGYGGADNYTPGINVPFNIASRHGSTFINGAVDGTALTEDTTPVALPDLSGTDLQIGYDFTGNIEEVRLWVVDIGDTGIAEASS